MPSAMTHGDPRSGLAEIVRNAKGVDQIAFKSNPNLANASGVDDFSEGEWVILDPTLDPRNPRAKKSTSGSAEVMAWPILIGKERADVRGSRTTAAIVGHGYHYMTTGYDTAGSYAYGTLLAVKSGKLTPALTGEQVLAVALAAPVLVQGEDERALGRPGFTVLIVEVGPKGRAP